MNCYQIVDIVCKLITVIVSLVNLVFVVNIHNKDVEDRKAQEEQKKKDEWYRALEIRSLTTHFAEALDKYINEYYIRKKKSDISSIVSSINEDFLLFQKKFHRAVLCLDESKDGFILKQLHAIQDNVVNMSNMISQDLKKEQVIAKKDEIAIQVIKLSSLIL